MEGGCRRRDPCWVERKRHIREGRVARSSLCRGSFIRGLAGAQLELFLGLGILREAIRYGDKEPPRGSAPHPANRGAAVLAGKQKAASIVGRPDQQSLGDISIWQPHEHPCHRREEDSAA